MNYVSCTTLLFGLGSFLESLDHDTAFYMFEKLKLKHLKDHQPFQTKMERSVHWVPLITSSVKTRTRLTSNFSPWKKSTSVDINVKKVQLQ